MDVQQNEILLVVGMKGSGKTTLARAIFAAHPRAAVLDSRRQFGGAPIASGQTAADWLWPRRDKGDFSVIVRPTGGPDEADFWSCWGEEGFMRDCLLVVDEIDRYIGPSSGRPELEHVIHYGRHDRVSLVATARRPANVGPLIRSQADCIASFAMRETVDLEALASRLPAAELPTLGVGDYIISEPCGLIELGGKPCLSGARRKRRRAGSAPTSSESGDTAGELPGDDDG